MEKSEIQRRFRGFDENIVNLTKVCRFVMEGNLLQKKTGMSIGLKIFLGIFVVVMAGVIVISYLSFSFSKSTIKDQVSKATQQTIDQIKGKLDLVLGVYDSIGLQVLKNSGLRDDLEYVSVAGRDHAEQVTYGERIKSLLSGYRDSNEFLVGVRLVQNQPFSIDKDNLELDYANMYTSRPTNNIYLTNENFSNIQEMIAKKGETVFTGTYQNGFYTKAGVETQRITTGPTFVMGKIVNNLLHPEATYLLMLEISLKSIGKIIKDAQLGESSEVIVLDRENHVVYSNDMNLLGKASPIQIDEEFKDKTSGAFFKEFEDGQEHMVVFNTSKEYGWKVIGHLPTKVLYKDIDTTLQLSITTSIVMFLIVLFSLILLRRFVSTHQRLQVYSNQLEQTSFELKEKNDALTQKTDEVVQQSELLSSQNDQLGRQSRELERKNKELAKQSAELETKNDELHQLNQVKDKILANTSHELRTPLNGIIGIAESLIDGVAGKITEKMQQNLQIVVMSGRRLSALVNDILDFSKLKSNKFVLSRRAVSASDLVNLVILLSKPLIADKPVELRNDLGKALPLIDVDENRFQQIIHNLISNAIKFTEKGQVRVSGLVEGTKLAITVHDTGMGIPQDKLEDIFKSFEQVDGSISRKYGGTGLGLAVTKQLVELHGGEINVNSQEGKGSSFTITLPIALEATEENPEVRSTIQKRLAETQLALSESTKISDRQMKIQIDTSGDVNVLIVDDEPINLQVLTNQLSTFDFGLTTATNGIEALALVKSGKKFDIILLDVMMPEMSGYEVCQLIRKTYTLQELPIILLTAKNQTEDLLMGFNSGANDYLVKPFSKQELIVRMNMHLKLAKSSRQLKAMKERIETQSQTYANEIEILKEKLEKR